MPTVEIDTPDIATREVRAEQRTLMQRVFALLALGLLTSAAVSYWAATDPGVVAHVSSHPEAFYILFCLEVVVIGVLSKHFDQLSTKAAAFAFFLYSAVNGLSFIVFFLWMPATSMAWGLALTAVTFGALFAWGYYARRDLGTLRNIARFAIAGLAVGVLANLVLGNRMAYWATPYIFVTVFSGLLAHHAQDIRDMEYEFDGDDSRWKSAFAGALLIYLDLVNLYILAGRLIDWLKEEDQAQDNILSWERMLEFRGFLAQFKFPVPLASAIVSVYAQCVCAVLYLLGLFTRPAAVVMIFNFTVALLMVHLGDPYPPAALAFAMFSGSLFLLLYGPGEPSVDDWLSRLAE